MLLPYAHARYVPVPSTLPYCGTTYRTVPQVGKEVQKELESEKPEGEQALNDLFKSIYGKVSLRVLLLLCIATWNRHLGGSVAVNLSIPRRRCKLETGDFWGQAGGGERRRTTKHVESGKKARRRVGSDRDRIRLGWVGVEYRIWQKITHPGDNILGFKNIITGCGILCTPLIKCTSQGAMRGCDKTRGCDSTSEHPQGVLGGVIKKRGVIKRGVIAHPKTYSVCLGV